jgi:demethylmenaquinone methyltransferase/2-methoxy-6-polyprenyl-1,4-benzoquinol methylase
MMERPHIEITGFKARYYDLFVLLGTFGLYQKLIKTVIRVMGIKPADKVLDFGAGSGKNTCIMEGYLSKQGSITALEIGEEMTRKFNKKCGRFDNVSLENLRIEKTLPFIDEFDKAFMSFVIHGFTHDIREKIIHNAFTALKPGGKLFIFDWNEFDLNKSGLYIRTFMKYIECPEARDFIKRDFTAVLSRFNFKNISEKTFAHDKLRLISAQKLQGCVK